MTVLVIAPHADDEVLGMGGSISQLCLTGADVVVAVLTGHGEAPHPIWPQEHWDVVRKECRDAAAIMGVRNVQFRELPAACLDHVPAHLVNQVVADLIRDIQPADVYVPFSHDLHKDHSTIAYAVSVATRPYLAASRAIKRILAYETLSETHLAPPYLAPAFQPNVFVNITATLDRKLEAMKAYKSQLQADGLPRSLATLHALAKLRGSHIGVSFAEAFVLVGEYHR